jgi:hypothetical protein
MFQQNVCLLDFYSRKLPFNDTFFSLKKGPCLLAFLVVDKEKRETKNVYYSLFVSYLYGAAALCNTLLYSLFSPFRLLNPM